MNKGSIVAITALLVIGAAAWATNYTKAIKPEDLPFIIVYKVPGSRTVSEKPGAPTLSDSGNLMVAMVCSDGQTVWSKNGIAGGPPYLSGRIDPQALRKFITDLDKRGVFEDKALTRAWFGPDSQSTVIEIRNDKKTLRMQSWHELYERNPNLVATTAGLEPLKGKSREDVLKSQPEEYRRFRAVWDLVRKQLQAWTASDSKKGA